MPNGGSPEPGPAIPLAPELAEKPGDKASRSSKSAKEGSALSMPTACAAPKSLYMKSSFHVVQRGSIRGTVANWATVTRMN